MLINLAMFAGSIYGFFYFFTSASWWGLSVIFGFFILICGFNLYNIISGKESEQLQRMVKKEFERD